MVANQPGMRRHAESGLTGKVATLVALTFLLVGILGFIPGVTTDYGKLEFWGPDSEAMLLGIFEVSILHNLVHIGFGLVGLAMAQTMRGATGFLVGGGILYLALWVYGLVVDQEASANFVPVNTADNWLHFALGAGMVVLGLAIGGRATAGADRAFPT